VNSDGREFVLADIRGLIEGAHEARASAIAFSAMSSAAVSAAPGGRDLRTCGQGLQDGADRARSPMRDSLADKISSIVGAETRSTAVDG